MKRQKFVTVGKSRYIYIYIYTLLKHAKTYSQLLGGTLGGCILDPIVVEGMLKHAFKGCCYIAMGFRV